jgi:undecaprenyl-diphosphatase
MLMVTALLLWLADRAKNTGKPVSFKDAVIVGIAQAVAILPGVSRSGATISTAVLLGIDKGRAARFSFLMVVPLILGKIAKDLLDGSLSTDTTNLQVVILGFAAAFISGLVACKWMLSLVRNSKLTGFAVYCLVVGLAALLIGLFV